MKAYDIGTDVYVPNEGIFGIVDAVCYYEDFHGILKYGKELDEYYPFWKLKPIYVITIYDGLEIGSKQFAIHDILSLTSELN